MNYQAHDDYKPSLRWYSQTDHDARFWLPRTWASLCTYCVAWKRLSLKCVAILALRLEICVDQKLIHRETTKYFSPKSDPTKYFR